MNRVSFNVSRRRIEGVLGGLLLFLLAAAVPTESAMAGISLGDAGDFAVLQFNNAAPYSTSTPASQNVFSISGGSTVVNGLLGSAAYTRVNFSGNPPNGPLDQSTTGTGGNNYNGISPVQGAATNALLDQAAQDAINASQNAASLTATQTVNSTVTGGQTFTGNGGLNVIDLTHGINMTTTNGITITGNANDTFIFNVSSQLTSNNGASITLVGVSASQIIWNYLGTSDASFTGGGHPQTWEGTVLSVNANITAHDRTFDGALIGGENITITSNPVLNFTPFMPPEPVPEPTSLALWGIGGTALLLARRRTGRLATSL